MPKWGILWLKDLAIVGLQRYSPSECLKLPIFRGGCPAYFGLVDVEKPTLIFKKSH